MANSKYAYVKDFELPDFLLPGTCIVFRLDGHSFHRFSDEHSFTKPNDVRALELMDEAARSLLDAYPDIMLAFGESDEYSFLLRKSTSLYNRRQAKIVSTLTSYFTSSYVFNWSRYFPNTPLKYPPSFDGRVVLYPGAKEIRDYFAWRQVDTHINNLYNTTFWTLVQQGGQTPTQAHATLRGTIANDKNEILYKRFNINYNQIDERFRKGSILVREPATSTPELPPRSIAYGPHLSIDIEAEATEPSSGIGHNHTNQQKYLLLSTTGVEDPSVMVSSMTLQSSFQSATLNQAAGGQSGVEDAKNIKTSFNTHSRVDGNLGRDTPTSWLGNRSQNDRTMVQSNSESENPLNEKPIEMNLDQTIQRVGPASTSMRSVQEGPSIPASSRSGRAKNGRKGKKEKGKNRDREGLGTGSWTSGKSETQIRLLHCDIIKDEFWITRPWLLAE